MEFIRETLSIPFGWLIGFFYDISNNFVFSLLLMTLCVKLVLLPSSIKQQKGMIKTQRMQPKLKRIKEKYAGNQQKINEATQELYAKEGYSAMGGGCLPLLIQLPVMMGVFSVNYKIFEYVLKIKDSGTIAAIKEAVKALPVETLGEKNVNRVETQFELFAIQHWDAIDKTAISVADQEKIERFVDSFEFLGVNLARTPETGMGWDLLWLIPILTGVTSFMMAIYTWLRQKKTNPEMANNPSMGCMSLTTPLMSIFFSFSFPASVGVYIIISSVLSFIQMLITNKIYSPKKLLAKSMVDETINRRAREKILKNVADTLDEDNTEV